jgi:hypothetical protein
VLLAVHDATCAEMRRVEAAIEQERETQKKLVGMLAEKGGAPEGCGPGLLRAFLTLDDKSS